MSIHGDRQLHRLARRIARLEQRVKIRTPQLIHSSLDDGALIENDLEGNLVQVIGKQFDGTHTTASVGGPLPPQPTSPILEPVPGGLNVTWDGLWEAGVGGSIVVAPMDWIRSDITIGPVSLDPIATPPTASIVSPRGGTVFVPISSETETWVAVVARTESGKATASAVDSATPLPGGSEGPEGKSAFQVWLEAGNVGTEADFLASLQGAPGDPGDPGDPGPPGDPGLVWRGAYVAGTLYAVNDAVTYAGSSYRFIGGSPDKIKNGSFETDTTGWNATSSTLSRVVGPAASGAAYLRVQATGTGAAIANIIAADYVPAAPGSSWTLSANAINEIGARTLALRLRWRDAADAILSESTLAGVTPAAAWATRLSLTAVAPASTAKVEARLVANAGATGDRAGFDAVTLVQATTTPDLDTTNWAPVAVKGDPGNTGPPGLTWKGAWAAATAYVVNDAVTYGRGSYRRLVAGTTATDPAHDAVNWALFAGEPPAVAPNASPVPQPVGIPGAIQLRLPPPASANTPTVVDVFMNDSSPVPLDATHKHGTAASGSLYTVEKMPAGTGGAALEYVQADGVTPKGYFFVAVARNAEDNTLSATASAEVEGSMRQVTGPDVSVNAVWAGWVSATRLTSGTTEAQIVLAGQMESQNTAGPMFGRVGLSQADGFYSRGVVPAGGTLDDAPVLVHFPTNGSPNLVSGILEAEKLTVTGGATFRAVTSMETEASLILEQGVQPPKAAPAYVIGYNSTTHVPTQDLDADRVGLTKGHDGNWVTVKKMDALAGQTSKIERYDANGAVVGMVTLPTVGGGKVNPYGIVWTGTKYLVLVFNPDRFTAGGSHYYVLAYDTAFSSATVVTTDLGIGAVVSNNDPCIGWDHTNGRALIAYADKGFSPPRVRVDTYTVAVGGGVTFLSTWLTPATYTKDYDIRYVARGVFDYGDAIDRTILRPQPNVGGSFAVFTTSSNVERPQDEWPQPAGYATWGAWWDGAKFYSVNGSNVRTRYQGGRNMWVSGSSRWSFDDRFLDSTLTRAVTIATTSGSKLFSSASYIFGVGDTGVAISGAGIPAGTTIESVTAGTTNAVLSAAATATGAAVVSTFTSTKHETPPSPRASFTMTKRAQVTLTLPAVPTGRGGVNDADSHRVWYGKGDTDATTVMARERTLAIGVASMSFDGDTAAEGGVADPAFANSTPAELKSAALDPYGRPAIDLRGDGVAYAEMLTPLGVAFPSMFPITAGSEPKGWYKLDGREILGTLIPSTATVLGTGATSKWGSATAGYVRLPDMRGRMPIGAGTFAVFGATDGLAEASRTPSHWHNAVTPDGTLDTASFSWGGRSNAPTGGAQPVVGNIEGVTGGSFKPGVSGHTASASIPYAGVDWIARLA